MPPGNMASRFWCLALWPLLAGSRMLRGEEERGSMDALLSLPRGRVRVALEKAGSHVDGAAVDGG